MIIFHLFHAYIYGLNFSPETALAVDWAFKINCLSINICNFSFVSLYAFFSFFSLFFFFFFFFFFLFFFLSFFFVSFHLRHLYRGIFDMNAHYTHCIFFL